MIATSSLPVTTASSPEWLHLSGADGEVFVPAYAIEDTEPQRDLLTDQITAHVPSDWSGRPWADQGPWWPGRASDLY